MCYRESFVLFPFETGIPVAWTNSYHHEEILAALGRETNFVAVERAVKRGGFVQIECKDGDIHKWDWDNTPTKLIYEHEFELADWASAPENWEQIISFRHRRVPDLPSWLEDNLTLYENRVESILEKLNPWRDRWEILANNVAAHPIPLWAPNSSKEDIALTWLEIRLSAALDSPEVKEFETIINAYRMIDGYVERIR